MVKSTGPNQDQRLVLGLREKLSGTFINKKREPNPELVRRIRYQ